MPEMDSYLADLTAVELCTYAGELSGLPRNEAMQRAHAALYYAGLEEKRYLKVEGYSTGMKQRVKLAQALVHDPDLLLLDEPTNGLDPEGRDEMLGLIRDGPHAAGIGIRDIAKPDFGDAVEVREGELPVFWACGVTPQAALAQAKPPFAITHKPGHMFLTDLKDLGCEWREGEDGYRVFLSDGLGPELIFRAARDNGVQVRHLRPGAESLEDVFLRALGHGV
jgi:ABC-2 type transport system ATP-binding protein